MCFLKRLGKVLLLVAVIYLFVGFLIGILIVGCTDPKALTTVAGWDEIGYNTVGWPVMLLVVYVMAKSG